MKTTAKNLDDARFQAISLLSSIASVFEATPAWLVHAIDATWELYLEAHFERGENADGVAHFCRGFMHILATAEHDMTPAPQAMALAA
jgi:hypothetical protein